MHISFEDQSLRSNKSIAAYSYGHLVRINFSVNIVNIILPSIGVNCLATSYKGKGMAYNLKKLIFRVMKS